MLDKKTYNSIQQMIINFNKQKMATKEIEQTLKIVEIAQLISKEDYMIAWAEIDDYKTVSFTIRIGKDIWDIEMRNDYSFEILRNLVPYEMCDTVYSLMKDLFTPVRYKVYELHDNKKLLIDQEIENEDFSFAGEELITLGLDDDSDESFCYKFN